MSATDLANWQGRPVPDAVFLEGKYTRLERLSLTVHSDRGLMDAVLCPDAATRFAYLPENGPTNKEEYLKLMKEKESTSDPRFYATIDKSTGTVGGYIAIQRISAENGVYEIGHVYMGPNIARTRISTEAVYLLLRYAFNQLDYRRVEWKCNNLNLPSKNAALRFGFQYEGLFRKHLVVKGENRDTAWFSIVDDDWRGGVEDRYLSWLDESNFTTDGQQINTLNSFR